MNTTESTAMAASIHPVLWAGAAIVLVVVSAQCLIYLRAAKRAAVGVGMDSADFKAAFRTGGIAAIGPSLAICLVALAILPVFSTPSTVTRIGLVGSAAYETIAANLATGTMGVALGGEGMTGSVFVTMLLSLAIAGSGWMVVTLVATPLLKKGVKKSVAPGIRKASRWAILPAAAMLGVFITMGFKEASAGWASAAVFLVSAAVMLLSTYFAKITGKAGFLEWALGLSMVAGIAVGYFTL